jgi:hypothetical protein
VLAVGRRLAVAWFGRDPFVAIPHRIRAGADSSGSEKRGTRPVGLSSEICADPFTPLPVWLSGLVRGC